MSNPKNQIFITLDSLRWDVFQSAQAPFLKGLGEWKKAYTPGNYTLPAHMSFFMGKIPQTFDQVEYYDSVALHSKGLMKKRLKPRGKPFWRLSNPEAKRDARTQLEGENIIDGYKKLGYETFGTGAASWFNYKLAPGKYLTESFDDFAFFDGPDYASHKSANKQIAWAEDKISNTDKPYFLFINFGETHHRFIYEGCEWEDDLSNPYGDRDKCLTRQRMCLEYLDGKIEKLLSSLNNYDLVICSDHGEALGESNLWGHGFHHKTINEVPLLIACND